MWFQLSMDAFSLYCALPVTLGPTGLPHLWCCLSSPWWSCGEDCFLMWSHLAGCCSATLLGEAFFHSSLCPNSSCCIQVFPEQFLLWRRIFCCCCFSDWLLSSLGLTLPLVLLWKQEAMVYLLCSFEGCSGWGSFCFYHLFHSYLGTCLLPVSIFLWGWWDLVK